MEVDSGKPLSVLRVDGGASVSDVMMQFQSDILNKPIDRPEMVETTAFGAAALAGLAVGVWKDLEELTALRRSQHIFTPVKDAAECKERIRQWRRAVERCRSWVETD